MNVPLVSVVIPAHNAGPFLAETLQSVLTQEYSALEVIVVDNGSTDNTFEIASTTGDSRVRVLQQSNRGVAGARNRAIEESSGELIALLDADDLWDPSKTARQVALLESRPDVVAVGSLLRYISPDGTVLGIRGQTLDEADEAALRAGALMPVAPASLLIRRRALDAVGLFAAHPSEDLELLARLARHGRVVVLDEVLGGYRMHPNSVSMVAWREILLSGRYIQAKFRALDRGEVLEWEDYLATYRPTLNERRLDRANAHYRRAGLSLLQRRRVAAGLHLAAASVLDPPYVVRKLGQQRPWALRRGPVVGSTR